MFEPRVSPVLSLALAFLLMASAESATTYSQTSGNQAQSWQQRGNATPMVYGQTIGNWGQSWWQWVSNFPAAEDPILQDGSVDCSAGQSGKVWYLAGTFGGAAERTCSIKKGKAIFFPLLNGIYWTPLDPAIPEDCTDEANCRAGDLLPADQWHLLDNGGLHGRGELPHRGERGRRRPHQLDVHSRRYPVRLVRSDRPCAVRCSAVEYSGWIKLY